MMNLVGLILAGILLFQPNSALAQLLRRNRQQPAPAPVQVPTRTYEPIPIPLAQPPVYVGESGIQPASAMSSCQTTPGIGLNSALYQTPFTLKDLGKIDFLITESDLTNPYNQQLAFDQRPSSTCVAGATSRPIVRFVWNRKGGTWRLDKSQEKILEKLSSNSDVRQKLNSDEMLKVMTKVRSHLSAPQIIGMHIDQFTVEANKASVMFVTEEIFRKQLLINMAEYSSQAREDIFQYAMRDFQICINNGCTDPQICAQRFSLTAPARVARVIFNQSMRQNLETLAKGSSGFTEEKKESLLKATDEAYKKCVVERYFPFSQQLGETQKTSTVTACGFVASLEVIMPVVELKIGDTAKGEDKEKALVVAKDTLRECFVEKHIYSADSQVNFSHLQTLSSPQFQKELTACTDKVTKNTTATIGAQKLDSLTKGLGDIFKKPGDKKPAATGKPPQ